MDAKIGKRIAWLVALAAILFLVLLAALVLLWPVRTGDSMKIGDTRIQLQIADTDAQRELGLSGRGALPADTGMLFVFDENGMYSFWMKDMKFSLDMIWISATSSIVTIAKSVSPETFPQTFISVSPARYILEVPAGFSDSQHVQVGQTVKINVK